VDDDDKSKIQLSLSDSLRRVLRKLTSDTHLILSTCLFCVLADCSNMAVDDMMVAGQAKYLPAI
jgi:hypothetical protein